MPNYVKPICYAIIVLSLLGLFSYMSITKAYLAQDLADSQRDNVALTISNKNCQTDIAASNKAINDALSVEKARADAATAAVNTAMKEAKTYQDAADKIQMQKPDTSDDCKSTVDLVNKYFVRNKP